MSKQKYKCAICNQDSTFTRSSDQSINGMMGIIGYRCDNCKEIYSEKAFEYLSSRECPDERKSVIDRDEMEDNISYSVEPSKKFGEGWFDHIFKSVPDPKVMPEQFETCPHCGCDHVVDGDLIHRNDGVFRSKTCWNCFGKWLETVRATYADDNKINWRSDLNKPEIHTYKIPLWVVRLRLTKVWLWIMDILFN